LAEDNLKEQIGRWLGEQGYPLEFATAATFKKSGFRVMQGFHVDEEDNDLPREVDVIAEINLHYGDQDLIRIEHVVECKWSVEKPWVVFCSDGSIMPDACIAQTIGSKAARTALWARAGDPELHKLGIFATPDVPGFGGRQAFTTGRDLFYEAMKSIVTIAHARAKSYDGYAQTPVQHLHLASVVIPVVVVRGRLFTARYDDIVGRLVLDECDSTRLHWRGSAKWRLHATVDVVTENALSRFVETRKRESLVLGQFLCTWLGDLKEATLRGKVESWEIIKGARGVRGRPPLLKDLAAWQESIALADKTNS
jgi:hypothetical protein